MTRRSFVRAALVAACLSWLPLALAAENPCANPFAAENPCAANPCGGNPCATNACNPCAGAGVDPSRFKKPAGTSVGSDVLSAAVVARGEALWNDKSLSSNGLACATCHAGSYGQMNPSFAKPYPHEVAMPRQAAGVAEVDAAEMVNFCMIMPMANEPLAWDSDDLAALAAYVEHIQKGFVPSATSANPCAANPCSANPCGG